MRQWLGILGLCVGSAIAYGIVHDQVTARVCVEYFTVAHPPRFDTDDPTLLGLGWGIIATWWVGLILSVPLILAARFGTRPKRSAKSLGRPIVVLLGIMAVCALAAGLTGYQLASAGTIQLSGPLAEMIPRERHARLLADLWAHSASYAVGLLGGLIVVAWVWFSRGRIQPDQIGSDSREA